MKFLLGLILILLFPVVVYMEWRLFRKYGGKPIIDIIKQEFRTILGHYLR